MRHHYAPKGIVALVTVLIVMAVLLSIGLAISSIGRNEIVLSGTAEDGEVAFSIADACVEEGLMRLKLNAAYTGSLFALDGGECAITVTDLGGDDRLVRGQGSYRDAIRIIDAQVNILPNNSANAKKIKIESWKEAD